jgi:hypothetical protein
MTSHKQVAIDYANKCIAVAKSGSVVAFPMYAHARKKDLNIINMEIKKNPRVAHTDITKKFAIINIKQEI